MLTIVFTSTQHYLKIAFFLCLRYLSPQSVPLFLSPCFRSICNVYKSQSQQSNWNGPISQASQTFASGQEVDIWIHCRTWDWRTFKYVAFTWMQNIPLTVVQLQNGLYILSCPWESPFGSHSFFVYFFIFCSLFLVFGLCFCLFFVLSYLFVFLFFFLSVKGRMTNAAFATALSAVCLKHRLFDTLCIEVRWRKIYII